MLIVFYNIFQYSRNLVAVARPRHSSTGDAVLRKSRIASALAIAAAATAMAEAEADAKSSPAGPLGISYKVYAVFYVSVRLVRSAGYAYFSMRTSEERGRNCFPITTGHRRFPGMPDCRSEVQETALRTILLASLCAPAIHCYCSRPSSLIFPSL